MARTTYTVIYRTGGPERFQWKRSTPWVTKEAAVACATDVERAGYRAIVHETARLDSIGLPETWDA